ncbi:conserved virulence factor C family protein [Brevibacillus migulae]|uniref:conserved virulence factor C family protein n=1 Tax=Brevibacillus migulae TaxID=1644114 RepID=UPI00106EE641|nr:virulence factor [Brevibacillus migulae]
MKILSVEPTPSPNVMKLNTDETLPAGTSFNYSKDEQGDAPDWIKHMLAIEGVKGIFQVSDFIAVERNPKADWKDILSEIRASFGDIAETAGTEGDSASSPFGEIQVLVQTFKGIPIQVKLVTAQEERRFGLPERFRDAIMSVQSASKNYVLERQWEDYGVRYGSFDEVGEELVAELGAAYDEQRVEKLVQDALNLVEGEAEEAEAITSAEVSTLLNDPNWEKRFAALERMKPSVEDIPLLARALEDPKASIRRLATVYLGMIGEAAVLPHLFKALKDHSASVRRTAGDALSDIGDPQAIKPMIEALQDQSKLVRWRAARFLFEQGDETALPALEVAQYDPEFEVSLQAKMALERIERGEEASGTVWQQMTRRNDQR